MSGVCFRSIASRPSRKKTIWDPPHIYFFRSASSSDRAAQHTGQAVVYRGYITRGTHPPLHPPFLSKHGATLAPLIRQKKGGQRGVYTPYIPPIYPHFAPLEGRSVPAHIARKRAGYPKGSPNSHPRHPKGAPVQPLMRADGAPVPTPMRAGPAPYARRGRAGTNPNARRSSPLCAPMARTLSDGHGRRCAERSDRYRIPARA